MASPPSAAGKSVQLNVRLAPADLERVRALQRRLQAIHGASVTITARSVVLEALDALERYYDKLERDKQRPR